MTIELICTCPACGSPERTVMYAGVPDFVFHATDERWDIVRCNTCFSLYLPQRPNSESIGRYYDRYYTHHMSGADTNPISGIAVESSYLKRLANSWRNARHGTKRPSLGPLGVVAIVLAWPLRQWLEAECRHIPSALSRPRDFRVLDVGFGDGRFLRFATEAGCQAVGMEIDPKAVAGARECGLDVHAGDITAAEEIFGERAFDYITMSHVIEHVHSPREVLATAERMLKPGGTLWIETPNPLSLGHSFFGARWRDLDPPRHLCLMTPNALIALAASYGLDLAGQYYRPFVAFEVFPFSATASGGGKSRFLLWMLSGACELLAFFRPKRREWLTLSFTRRGRKT